MIKQEINDYYENIIKEKNRLDSNYTLVEFERTKEIVSRFIKDKPQLKILDLGAATAKIVEYQPGHEDAITGEASFQPIQDADFFNTPFSDLSAELIRKASTATIFDTTLERGERVLKERDVPHKEALFESLERLQQNRDAILSFPSFIQTSDFHLNNIIADGTKISGFIDLENARAGNEPLLLGLAILSLYKTPEKWQAFRLGYENIRKPDQKDQLFHLSAIAAAFSGWSSFMVYWSTDDQPFWTEFEDFKGMAVRDILEFSQLSNKM